MEVKSPYGGARQCTRCHASCPVGKYLTNCGNASEGACVPCTNPLPAFSHFSGGGNLTNYCPWECDEGRFYNGISNECVACNAFCPVGHYLKNCGGKASGTCVPCTGLWEGIYFTANGGLSDACPRSCNLGWWEREPGHCIKCNMPSCATGYYRSACRGTSPGYCAPCLNANSTEAPYLSYGDIHGRCPVDCGEGNHHFNGTCITCNQSCGVGRYFRGCVDFVEGQCADCTQKPIKSKYVSGGGLKDSCPWVCDRDFYYHERRRECVPCQTQMPCSAGMYRHCGNRSKGFCKPCTTAAKIEHAHYTTNGGLRNNCSFECDKLFFFNGHNCSSCIGTCPLGEYRIGCGLASEGTCRNCPNAPLLPFHIWEKVTYGPTDCHWHCPLNWPLDGGRDGWCSAVFLVDAVIFPGIVAFVVAVLTLVGLHVRMAMVKWRRRPKVDQTKRTLLADLQLGDEPEVKDNQALADELLNSNFANPSSAGALHRLSYAGPGGGYDINRNLFGALHRMSYLGPAGMGTGTELQSLKENEPEVLDEISDEMVDTSADAGHVPEVSFQPLTEHQRQLAAFQKNKRQSIDFTSSIRAEDIEVTLDRSFGEKLGIDIDHQNGVTLYVEAVTGGLMAGWNYANPGHEVEAGDQIVEVNGIRGDAWRLLNECEQHQLLQIRVERAAHAEDSLIN